MVDSGRTDDSSSDQWKSRAVQIFLLCPLRIIIFNGLVGLYLEYFWLNLEQRSSAVSNVYFC